MRFCKTPRLASFLEGADPMQSASLPSNGIRCTTVLALATMTLAFRVARSADDAARSPLDELDAGRISADDRTPDLPPETVAILGSNRGRHSEAAKCLAVSPDGKWVASGSRDHTIRIWHPSSLRELQVLHGHRGDVDVVKFAADSNRLYSIAWDGDLRTWTLDGDNWKLAEVVPLGLKTRFPIPILLRDAATIISIASETTPAQLAVYERTEGRFAQSRPLTGLRQLSGALAISADGRFVAAGGRNETNREVWVWDIKRENSDPRWRLAIADSPATSIVFTADRRHMIVGHKLGAISFWALEPRKPRLIGTIAAHKDEVSVFAFSPDGRRLASGAYDGSIRIWNWKSAKLTPAGTLPGHKSWVGGLGFSPDGRTLYSAGWDHTVRRWASFENGFAPEPDLSGHFFEITAFAFSHDGKTLAAASWVELKGGQGTPNSVQLWRFGGLSPMKGRNLDGCTGMIHGLTFSHDDRWLASASGIGILYWELQTGNGPAKIKFRPDIDERHLDLAESVAFAHDRPVLASGWFFDQLRFTDFTESPPKAVASTRGTSRGIKSMVFVDHKTIAAADARHRVPLYLFEQSGSELKIQAELAGLEKAQALAVSPDGTRLAGSDDKGKICIWNLSNRAAPPATLRGHDAVVSSVAFGNRGRTLASGDHDGTLILWDVESGKAIVTRQTSDSIRRLEFAPDGRHLAVGGGKGVIYILRFDWKGKAGNS
jgi:WD40 repeat protein